jgi:hypothetical protein
MKTFWILSLSVVLLVSAVAAGVQHHHDIQSPAAGDQGTKNELEQATAGMASKHMDMGAHMKMTHLRAVQPDDVKRADEIVRTARQVLEHYKDYRVAEKEGYQIFLPNVPQAMYHFTNYTYGIEAAFRFNAEHPTSLLYEKDGDGYRLIGAMYTAPWRTSEDDLNKRVPLSVAQWHQHVNFCFPPKERNAEMFIPNPRFGMLGSITNKTECDAAGGRFVPRLFGWMVHVYPFEKNPEAVWSVERQMPAGQHVHH